MRTVMARSLPIPPPGFDELSLEEKIDYVQSLWDRIAVDADTVPLTDWQKKVLDRRLADLERNPDIGVPWEEVRARLRQKLDGGGG